ncbi:MAG: hypothetical protein OEZ65_15755 [Gemmatimonadota bacterium]|nr:hypothetical protein [Gemmatimonadota bacterium]MDH5761019.1 hypothetical protein [Gemmatimonadota bacterium]
MSSEDNVWYKIGYALERARRGGSLGKKLHSLRERSREPDEPVKRPRRHTDPDSWPSADTLLASGAVALATKLLDRHAPSRGAGLPRSVRAGAAGAAAALAVELTRPLLRGKAEWPELDEDTVQRLLAGVGQGILYASVVEPTVPGPPMVKGALYGAAEYAVDPMGGLTHLLGTAAMPPVVGSLLEALEPHDRTFVEHLAFAISLALLYGSSRSSNGIRDDDE